MKMIKWSKEELEEKVKISRSFQEFQKNLGYSESYNTRKRLIKLVNTYGIDISHFDRYHFGRDNAWPLGEKECSFCKKPFITKLGGKREHKYCSRVCANGAIAKSNIGKKHSEEFKQKLSHILKERLARLGTSKKPDVEKVCPFCKNPFFVKYSNRNIAECCSQSCSSKYRWLSETYRENHSKRVVKMIKDGKFGWRVRKELSFPERLYKQFLEENGFKNKFTNNHPICKNELDKDAGYYYLDFYFPEFNLDLEIDGQQHKKLDRIESDINRDESLRNRGYEIFRLEWRQITTQPGKEFLENQKKKLLEFLRAHDVITNMQS